MAPEGWETTEKDSINETKYNELKIDGTVAPGMVFYYPLEVINPGEGVYFSFKYIGAQPGLTLGFDNVQANGELVPNGEDGFHSVAMLLEGQNPSVIVTKDKFQRNGIFVGNISLKEDTWYHIALAYDEKGDYIIKIWDPGAARSPLVYIRNWAVFPDAYYFISWVPRTRSLWMDDFTIFYFDSIIENKE